MPGEVWGEKNLRLERVSFLGLFRHSLIPNLILWDFFQAEILSMHVTFAQIRAPCHLGCLNLYSNSSIILEDLSVEA